MLTTELTTANALLANLDKLSAVKRATVFKGLKAGISILSAAGSQVVSTTELRAALGNDVYDAIAETTYASAASEITNAYTAAKLAFDAFVGTNND